MMSHPIPWIGLAAIVAMFVLPMLPAWLFEGPRTSKRYPRRVVCGDCGQRWTDDHRCDLEVVAPRPPRRAQPRPPLRAELRRVGPGRALARRSARSSVIRRF
jgi:hypothetical protein